MADEWEATFKFKLIDEMKNCPVSLRIMKMKQKVRQKNSKMEEIASKLGSNTLLAEAFLSCRFYFLVFSWLSLALLFSFSSGKDSHEKTRK